jgi:hypothetical protein
LRHITQLLTLHNIGVTLKRLPVYIVLLISCSAFGQDRDRTATFLNTFLSVDQSSTDLNTTFDAFLTKLERKRGLFSTEKDFVRYVFAKTHKAYLKVYSTTAPFNDLFKTGSYNCLTGTVIYSVLLNHFGINHQVIETNYHIFILADTKEGRILLEATDPFNGFVSAPSEIENRVKTYRANLIHPANSKEHFYHFNFALFNPVSPGELRGLLLYNKAVEAYNHKNIKESVQFLTKASEHYTSPRIDEFSQILLLSLQQKTFEKQFRTDCIKAILAMKRETAPAVASVY